MYLSENLFAAIPSPYYDQIFIILFSVREKLEYWKKICRRWRFLAITIKKQTNWYPKSGDEQYRQEEVDEKCRPGVPDKSGFKENKGKDEKRAHDSRFDDIEQVNNAGIAPHATVKAKEIKTAQFRQQNPRQHLFQWLNKIHGDTEFEPNQVRSDKGRCQQYYIGKENN